MPLLSSIAEAAASIDVNYNLGEVHSVERLSGGTTQANYLLEACSGSFVLRSYLTRNTEYVSFEIDALSQLAASLYDVANLLYRWANPAMDNEHWQERAREALLAYQEVRSLTLLEQSQLYDMLKLVFLMNMAWFLHLPTESVNDKKGIEALNRLGAPAFREQLFGSL